jgi:hypothetical protein
MSVLQRLSLIEGMIAFFSMNPNFLKFVMAFLKESDDEK